MGRFAFELFVEVGGEIVVRRAGAQSADRAQQIVDRMLGAGHSPLTTEEIIAIARGYDD